MGRVFDPLPCVLSIILLMNLFKFSGSAILAFLVYSGFGQSVGHQGHLTAHDPLAVDQVPPQPSRASWHFVDDLKSPFWTTIQWENRNKGAGYADLRSGIRLMASFPDPKMRLETAFEDHRNFCVAGKIPNGKGGYPVSTVMDPSLKGEAFRLTVRKASAEIAAGDVEGIRRGIFYLQDEMQRVGDPYLRLGSVTKSPEVKRRISRCFFSPIKRPGNQAGVGDELFDDIDYYPDEYLNRLAHEGVNGLWVTVSSKDGQENSVGFSDLVSTDITPDAGVGGEKRLAKLRSIVNKCLRYGIRIYMKTMEPHVRFALDDPRLQKYPDLAGGRRGDSYYLCASGTAGQTYLYQAVNKIFRAVPELGGIVNISHGELYTTCLSALPATGGGKINCPRCSSMPPWQILHHSLSAMNKGMKEAAPDAEIISWLYMPQPQFQTKGAPTTLAEWVYDIPSHTPEGVVLQFNFESGIRKTVFGKELVGGDYWLSAPGPSERFERIAEDAVKNNTQVSAKIQTSVSHEVATVPYVPVPSLIYRKFTAMRKLGVTHTMLSWIMGSYPGLMVKAAEQLSFGTYPDEETFLRELASYYWRNEDVSKIVQAWKHFSQGYENYPLTNIFQYLGPMHDGPVWPLLLTPRDAPLSPTYQLGSRNTFLPWPPSGDRIGESFPEILSLEEMVTLCMRMSDSWETGLRLMESVGLKYTSDKERMLDIGVAKAIGIQLRSGYNILLFYQLREKMFRMEGKGRLSLLDELKRIVEEEMRQSGILAELCKKDSRLGFHPEAEGYKYYPEKLQSRIDQLKRVLTDEIPAIRLAIEKGEPLFPEYTGQSPRGAVAFALPANPGVQAGLNGKWNRMESGDINLQWAAFYSADTLQIVIGNLPGQGPTSVAHAMLKIEPERLWPARSYVFKPLAGKPGVYRAQATIPLAELRQEKGDFRPMRLNVIATMAGGKTVSWLPEHPLTPRIILGTQNSADLGWLIFK